MDQGKIEGRLNATGEQMANSEILLEPETDSIFKKALHGKCKTNISISFFRNTAGFHLQPEVQSKRPLS